jgi:pSer/pThr/pTyr-binding forkhead associated (FHA) protein
VSTSAGERPWRPNPSELQQQLALERRSVAFLAFQTAEGIRFFVMPQDAAAVSIGRDDDRDVQLAGDRLVSGLHAELRRLGSEWVLVDDGLSRNGTFVNGERIGSRRRMRNGDRIRCGQSQLRYHAPETATSRTQLDDLSTPPALSPAQRRVLVALCRPCAEGAGLVAPASNRAIADELVLSLEAVKTHIRALFARFDVGDLPQNQKRARLVDLALRSRAVTFDELSTD